MFLLSQITLNLQTKLNEIISYEQMKNIKSNRKESLNSTYDMIK